MYLVGGARSVDTERANSIMAKTRSTSKGSTHRFGGDWTDAKLEVLAKYLKSYTTALEGKPTPCAYPKFSRCVMSASKLRQNARHDVSDAHDEPLGPLFHFMAVGITPGSDASTPLCPRVDTPLPSCERRWADAACADLRGCW